MKQKLLSEILGIGRVCRCANCPDVHVSIGPVDIRIPEDALSGLASLLNQALEEVRFEQAKKMKKGISRISWPVGRFDNN